MRELEHRGDRIAHDIIHRLSATAAASAGRRRAATARRARRVDGHALATALDDIVDFAEQTADALGVYGVEAPMEQSVMLAEVLVAASDEVAGALAALGEGDAAALGRRSRRSTGSRARATASCREGLACLFANGIDPMVVIRWKDIFESLESAVDACQTVAHVIEGIALKREL